MSVIVNIFIILFCIILSVSYHEFVHIIFYKIQRVKVVAFGIFCFNVIKGKIIVAPLGLYSFGGYTQIDTKSITSDDEIKKITNKITINHRLTVIASGIVALVSLVPIIMGNENLFLLTFLIINTLIVLNAFYSHLGDLKVVRSIKSDDALKYLYLISSEILNGYKNKYLYESTIEYLSSIDFEDIVELQKIILLNLINYVIDYQMCHDLKTENRLLKYVISNRNIVGIGSHLFYKMEIKRFIQEEIDLNTLISNLTPSKRYKKIIDCFLIKYSNGEATSYHDLTFEKRLGVLKFDSEVIDGLKKNHASFLKRLKNINIDKIIDLTNHSN